MIQTNEDKRKYAWEIEVDIGHIGHHHGHMDMDTSCSFENHASRRGKRQKLKSEQTIFYCLVLKDNLSF